MAGFFEETYYLKNKADQLNKSGATGPDGKPYTADTLKSALSELGLSPQDHYKTYGSSENLNPNPYFNEVEYLAAKKALLAETDPSWGTKSVEELRGVMERSGLTPAEHYEKYGAFEANSKGVLLNPSNAFDANAYFAAKLVELKSAGVEGVDTMTVAQVVEFFKESGISPVTHYETHGATEATQTQTPLVQTVPSEQRVANDPARTENVPGNYNPSTVGAASPDAAPAPVAKPADMGAKVPTTVSPSVTPPTKPLPVPGDSDYKAPPTGLVDTNEKPVVPPSDATGGNWAQVNPDTGAADLIKPDGTPGGTLPPGSLDPTDPSNPVPDTPAPNPDPNPGGGGGGGGSDAPHLTMSEAGGGVITITGSTGSQAVNVSFDASGNAFIGNTKVNGIHLDANDLVDASAVTGNGQLSIDAGFFAGKIDIKGSATASNFIRAHAVGTVTGSAHADSVRIDGTVSGKVELGAGSDTLIVRPSTLDSGADLSGTTLADNSKVTGLTDAGDKLEIEGAFKGLPEGSGGDVTDPGEWHYDSLNNKLTYYYNSGTDQSPVNTVKTLVLPDSDNLGVAYSNLMWFKDVDTSSSLSAAVDNTTLKITGSAKLISRVVVDATQFHAYNAYNTTEETSGGFTGTTIDASDVGKGQNLGNPLKLIATGSTATSVTGSQYVDNFVDLGKNATTYNGHSGDATGWCQDVVSLANTGNVTTMALGSYSSTVRVFGAANAAVGTITVDSAKDNILEILNQDNGAGTLAVSAVTTGAGNDTVELGKGASITGTLDMGDGNADTLIFATAATTGKVTFTPPATLLGVENIKIEAQTGVTTTLDLSALNTGHYISGSNGNDKILAPKISKSYIQAGQGDDFVIGGENIDAIDLGSQTVHSTFAAWAYTESINGIKSMGSAPTDVNPHLTNAAAWAKYPVKYADNIVFGTAGDDHIMCEDNANDVFVYQVSTNAVNGLEEGKDYMKTAAAFNSDTIFGFTVGEDFLSIDYNDGTQSFAGNFTIWTQGASDITSGKGYINLGSGGTAGAEGSHHATYVLKEATEQRGNQTLKDYALVITFDKLPSNTSGPAGTDALTINLVDVVGSLTSLDDLVYTFA